MQLGNNIRSILLIFLATALCSCGIDTSNTHVSTKSWTHPTDLTSDAISPAGQSSNALQVAMDDNGNAIIVWFQSHNVYLSEFRSEKWIHPDTLADTFNPEDTGAISPAVGMTNDGRAIVSWSQYDGSRGQIYKSEYFDNNWLYPSSLDDHINPNAQIWADSVRVATGNNDAIIIWEQFDGQNYQIYKSEFRDGNWIHPPSLSDHVSPAGQDTYFFSQQVAMDANGNTIIVWTQRTGTGWEIFKSEYRNGTWSHPSSLSDNISFDGHQALFPQVAMGDNGDAIIVWQQNTSDGIQIFKSEYRNNTWSHPTSFSDSISPLYYSGDWAFNPQVAMNAEGTAIICWQQCDSSDSSRNIYKSEYHDGLWNHPADLSEKISPDGGLAEYPQVALDNNNNAIIVWNQSNGLNSQVFKSEFRDGRWLNPSSINDNISPNGQSAILPEVAMSNNGNAIIVWQQSDGAQDQVFMSEYR